MSRTVPEWIGRTDDEPFPPRVRLRILLKHNGKCANCGNKIVGTFTADHIVALINGGENRENNGQPLCRLCTPIKDAADSAIKSKTADMAKATHGLKKRKWRGFRKPSNTQFDWSKGRYVRTGDSNG